MSLQELEHISQIVVAATAVIGAAFILFEYQRSKRNQRIDLAVFAIRNWDDRIGQYTQPAVHLVSDHKDDHTLLEKIKDAQTIALDRQACATRSYGFLIDQQGEIKGAVVNELRMAMIHYLNAWETVSYLYNNGRAETDIIDVQLNMGQNAHDALASMRSFMDLYGADSWQPFRDMVAAFREPAKREARSHRR